jgi:hypothetical protein
VGAPYVVRQAVFHIPIILDIVFATITHGQSLQRFLLLKLLIAYSDSVGHISRSTKSFEQGDKYETRSFSAFPIVARNVVNEDRS